MIRNDGRIKFPKMKYVVYIGSKYIYWYRLYGCVNLVLKISSYVFLKQLSALSFYFLIKVTYIF